ARDGRPLVLTFHSIVPQMRVLARLTGGVLGMRHWRACLSAVSHRVARDIQSIAPARPIRILPNGVDADFWCEAKQPTDPAADTARLLSVMRLNSKKRPLALLQTMRRLRDLLDRNHRVELRIVGDGPLRARVERTIARMNLTDRIELLGHQPRERIRQLMAD